MSPGLQLIHIGVYLKILRLSRLFHRACRAFNRDIYGLGHAGDDIVRFIIVCFYRNISKRSLVSR